MRHYETGFLIAPNLPEEEAQELMKKMADVVSKKKGKMAEVDNWGKRKLAYPIKKFKEAFYVFFKYEGKPDIPSELERRFKQTEAIIRYLTVKKSETDNIRKKKKKASGIEKEGIDQEEKPEELEELLEENGSEEREEGEK